MSVNFSRTILLGAALVSPLVFAACGDDEGPSDVDPGGEFELPADPYNLSRCPEIADNPHMQFAAGFSNPENERLYGNRIQFEKAFGRDVIGNEDVEQTIVGRFWRSQASLPGAGNGIAGESVQFFMEEDGQWVNVGSTQTDDKGSYSFTIPAEHEVGVGSHRMLAILEATGTCTEHGVFVWPEGTKTIITDIDGTLTRDDAEFMNQLSNVAYVPLQNLNADAMTQLWAEKGYQVVYLTARPNDYRWHSRVWLTAQGFPFGPMETAETFVYGATAREYKGRFVTMMYGLGIDFVAAYGNAESDVQAYADGGIPKAQTFTINDAAGMDGTVAVTPFDWTSHISEYVSNQGEADNGF